MIADADRLTGGNRQTGIALAVNRPPVVRLHYFRVIIGIAVDMLVVPQIQVIAIPQSINVIKRSGVADLPVADRIAVAGHADVPVSLPGKLGVIIKAHAFF